MDVEWIRQQLDAKGVSQAELGAAIGLTSVQVNKVLSGYRRLESTEADKIRKFFGYRLPEEPTKPILIGGVIGENGEMSPWKLPRKRIHRPNWIPEEGVEAAYLAGTAGGHWALHGDMIFFGDTNLRRVDENTVEHILPKSLLGRPVIAVLDDGRKFLRYLAAGKTSDTCSLLPMDNSSEPFYDVKPRRILRTWAPLPREEMVGQENVATFRKAVMPEEEPEL